MATARLSINLDAIAANWRALNRMSAPDCQTGAVVKADAYGTGAGRVAQSLAKAGARRFFVATADEAAAVREALGHGPQINVFAGHMAGDAELIHALDLTPMLNSIEQIMRHAETLPGHAFGIQLDTGMNRLGLEMAEWQAVAPMVLELRPELIMSHLACADEPDHAMNDAQLAEFHAMTDGCGIPRSLSATGGILLGERFHFDLTRPGIGLHGGRPYDLGFPAVRLSLPVVQVREVQAGEAVGYAASWRAEGPSYVATVAAGYADGLPRTLSGQATLWAGDIPCPLIGRVSMDLITVDITHLDHVPEELDILGPQQTVDDLADVAGTIGYEILTSLGPRYRKEYLEDGA